MAKSTHDRVCVECGNRQAIFALQRLLSNQGQQLKPHQVQVVLRPMLCDRCVEQRTVVHARNIDHARELILAFSERLEQGSDWTPAIVIAHPRAVELVEPMRQALAADIGGEG